MGATEGAAARRRFGVVAVLALVVGVGLAVVLSSLVFDRDSPLGYALGYGEPSSIYGSDTDTRRPALATSESATAVRVRVVERDGGSPIAGATVKLSPTTHLSDVMLFPLDDGAGPTETTDSTGTAVFQAAGRDGWVVVRASGFTTEVRKWRWTELVEVAMGRGHRLEGLLVDSRNRPVPGVPLRARPTHRVTAAMTDAWGLSSPGDSVVTTDESGRFSFLDLTQEPHAISPATPDWMAAFHRGDGSAAHVVPGQAEVVVRVRPVRFVRFRLVDDVTGEVAHPVVTSVNAYADAVVGNRFEPLQANMVGDRDAATPLVPSLLRYSRSVYPEVLVVLLGGPGPRGGDAVEVPTQVRLTFNAGGYEDSAIPSLHVERPSDLASDRVQDVRLLPLVRGPRSDLVVDCRRSDAPGLPRPYRVLSLRTETRVEDSGGEPAAFTGWVGHGTLVGDDRWRFSGLPAGIWTATVSDGLSRSRPLTVALTAGDSTEVDVEWEPVTGLRVEVVDEQGRRLVGFALTYKRSEPIVEQLPDGKKMTLELGGFAPPSVGLPHLDGEGVPSPSFLQLHPGTYAIQMHALGRRPATTEAVVESGAVTTVRIAVEPAPK